MSHLDAELAKLEHRLQDDGIAFLLIQFVDIHGAAKVKLVPAKTLKTVAETGAGFAGGAVWGMGQGPHSHDMFARAGPRDVHPAALRARRRPVCVGSPRRRRAAPVLPAGRSSSGHSRRRGRRATSSTSASSPSSSWSSRTPTARFAAGTRMASTIW